MNSYPFTKADDDTVRRMWADGASLSEIGKVLGRTRSSIAGRIRRLGIPKKGPAHFRNVTVYLKKSKPKPKERKPPMLLRVVSVPESRPVSLIERTGCCYPTTGEKPHLFCNEPTEGRDYCEFHMAVMYPRWRAA